MSPVRFRLWPNFGGNPSYFESSLLRRAHTRTAVVENFQTTRISSQNSKQRPRPCLRRTIVPCAKNFETLAFAPSAVR